MSYKELLNENKKFFGINLLLFLVFLSIARLGFTQDIMEPSNAQIGFSSTVNDVEIIKLLEQYPVSLTTVLFWCSGIGGSHRTFADVVTKDFFKEAKVSLSNSFTDYWGDLKDIIKDFLDSYTEEEIYNDAKLQVEARSILNHVIQIDNILVTLKSNKPLFYGIEVEGNDQAVENICNDPMVMAHRFFKDRESASTSRGKGVSTTPEAYRDEYTAPSVLNTSPKALYQLLLNDLKKLEKITNQQGGSNE